jgi:hypothetical protein
MNSEFNLSVAASKLIGLAPKPEYRLTKKQISVKSGLLVI